MDIIETIVVAFVTLVSVLAVSFPLFNIYIKKAFRSNAHNTNLEAIFKQLNIKDFKVTDLNADKLDDTGFNRLVGLLSALYAQKQPNSGLAGLMAQLAPFMSSTQPSQPSTTVTSGGYVRPG